MGLIPDHGDKVSRNHFAGGRPPLPFVSNALSVKCDKANRDKKRGSQTEQKQYCSTLNYSLIKNYLKVKLMPLTMLHLDSVS